MATAKIFKQITSTMIKVIQTATETLPSVSQYPMTTEAAEISAQRVIEDEYQFWTATEVSIDFCALRSISGASLATKRGGGKWATKATRVTYVPSDRES